MLVKASLKQSRFGIASVTLCAGVMILYAYLILHWYSLESNGLEYGIEFYQFPKIFLSTLMISGLALGLGIAGLRENNRNRLFPLIGFAASILSLLGEFMVFVLWFAFQMPL